MDENELMPRDPVVPDLRAARNTFSVAGWGAFVILALGSLLQIGCVALISASAPELMQRPWGLWVFTFAPLYLIAFPIGILILRSRPRFEGEGDRMRGGMFLRALMICFFMMYAGNIIGNVVNSLLQAFAGVPAGNPLMTYATDDSLAWKILVMVVLAPILEELVFRKILIDRLRGYGEKWALFVTALIFGLFHGNLSQFFYAFGLGLVFGYVYLRTRRLRWSAILHMTVNFLGSVLAPALLAGSNMSAAAQADLSDPSAAAALFTPGYVAFLLYSVCMIALGIAGLVLLILRARKLRFDPAPAELPKGSRFSVSFLNAGMLLFILACLALMVYAAVQVS